jgi:hypothetical protein
MGRRGWIIVGVVAAVAVASLAAAYLTGLVIVGDPYSGVWNVEAKPADTGSLIKQTDDGYVFTALVGGKVMGWHPLHRDGRTLFGEWNRERYVFEYQPWSGHLVWTYRDHGILRVDGMPLKKAADSSAVPQRTN